MTLKITDETYVGEILSEISLNFKAETVSIKEIIRERVSQEVETYNNKKPSYFNGLVEPINAEKTINGYKLKECKIIDAEKQVYIALDAFQKNGFFILIDDLQCEDLEQKVELNADTKISFIKLTPLVGG